MSNIGIISGGGKLPIIIGESLIKKRINVSFFVIEGVMIMEDRYKERVKKSINLVLK